MAQQCRFLHTILRGYQKNKREAYKGRRWVNFLKCMILLHSSRSVAWPYLSALSLCNAPRLPQPAEFVRVHMLYQHGRIPHVYKCLVCTRTTVVRYGYIVCVLRPRLRTTAPKKASIMRSTCHLSLSLSLSLSLARSPDNRQNRVENWRAVGNRAVADAWISP